MSKQAPQKTSEDPLKDLEINLGLIGMRGVNFIPRMQNAESIGKNLKLASELDQLAILAPCVPYCAIVLANSILYVTQESVEQERTEEIRGKLEASKIYQNLLVNVTD